MLLVTFVLSEAFLDELEEIFRLLTLETSSKSMGSLKAHMLLHVEFPGSYVVSAVVKACIYLLRCASWANFLHLNAGLLVLRKPFVENFVVRLREHESDNRLRD